MIQESVLTPNEIESLTSYLKVLGHEMTLKQAGLNKSRKPVTVGSYYRTVQTGRRKVKSAILTVILSTWLGFVNPDNLRRLLDQAGRGVPPDESQQEQAVKLIDALLDQIVIGSRHDVTLK